MRDLATITADNRAALARAHAAPSPTLTEGERAALRLAAMPYAVLVATIAARRRATGLTDPRPPVAYTDWLQSLSERARHALAAADTGPAKRLAYEIRAMFTALRITVEPHAADRAAA